MYSTPSMWPIRQMKAFKSDVVDLRRSTVDLDFTCFNSMAGRNSPPTCVKIQKNGSAFGSQSTSSDQLPFVRWAGSWQGFGLSKARIIGTFLRTRCMRAT
jgi:hypothetical protein